MRFLPVLLMILALSVPGFGAERTWEVQTGYNFLALELTPDQTTTSGTLLETYQPLKAIFRFDSTAQSFQFQLRLDSGSLFGETFTILPLEGIILQSTAATSIPWQGNAASGDPFATTTPGFIFAGLHTAEGTAGDFLTRLGGYQSIFRWDDTEQKFAFLLRLDNGSLFGTDFNLEAGRGYFLRFDGTRTSGQGRFHLSGQLRIAGLIGPSYAPAASAVVTFGGLSATADANGRFQIQSSDMNLGTSELVIQYGDTRLSRLISVSDPVQHLMDWQYQMTLGRHLFTDVRVDASASGILGISTALTCRSGATDLELASNPLPAVSDAISQTGLYTQIDNALTTAWATAESAPCLENFTVQKDFSSFLALQDMTFRPLLKTISFSQPPGVVAIGSAVTLQTSATWSDGITSTVPDDHLFSVDNASLASISGDNLAALQAGSVILKLTSRGLETTTAVQLVASPLKTQWITDPSSGSFRVALDLAETASVTLKYGTAADSLTQSVTSGSTAQHLLTLDNLQPQTPYYWQLETSGTADLLLNNGGLPFTFTTPAVLTSIPSQISLGLRVLDSAGKPIPNVLGLISSNNSWPLAALTDANGNLLVGLGNLRDSSTGLRITLTTGSSVTIDIHHSSGSSTGNNYTLSGSSPYVVGTFTLP